MCRTSSSSSSQQDAIGWYSSKPVMKSKSFLRERPESVSRMSSSEMREELPEEEASLSSASLSLMQKGGEGFESGFGSFQEFLEYSCEIEMDDSSSSNKRTRRLTKRIKKTLLKCKYKRYKSGKYFRRTFKRAMNAFSLLFHGALKTSVNILIVLAVILALAV